ncbi:glycosyl hydrolase family 32 [Sinomonas cyclohexanicum]|uniref:beta-fructofuranosidase n=1 Tax=Sinomonas cyclohexanicum TaxID=322009 RepID=A0ABM7PYE1_SINCY|nr:glycoside hydrolase family 32 protein [Corynebacterium cyclohexanicum]BCT77315.1 glycosyl hydrolase family 32 [Corynebacterium cyclohexanicum]
MTSVAPVSSAVPIAGPAAHPDRSFPRLHPRPAQGWVNDPNGIVFADGRWHVFFQHNAESARHHRIHWGHVSSADLVRWDAHPLALAPQYGGPDAYGCWTGVATLDAGVPTAVYSGVVDGSGRSQVVLARGSADLVEWTQDGVVAAGMPDDPRVIAVRDPFLFEFAGHRWAIQGAGLDSGDAAILLYGADDLTAWEYHGVWLTSEDPVAAGLPQANIWECPQLVRSGGSWAAVFSLWLDDQLTGVGHLVGSLALDALTGLPVFAPRSCGLSDLGGSFYAPQAVQADDRVLVWGWAKEVTPAGVLGRTQDECDAVGWSGALTFPRELRVAGDAVELRPAPELAALRASVLVAADAPGAHDGAPRLALPDQAEAVLTGSGSVRLLLGDQLVWEGQVCADGEVRVLLDASIIEVYRAGGVATTLRAYPSGSEEYRLELGPEVRVQAWALAIPA